MASEPSGGGYSADVALKLVVDGQSFELAQIAPNFVVPAMPLNLPSGSAEVVMTVDGKRRAWKVRLPAGASTQENLIRTTS